MAMVVLSGDRGNLVVGLDYCGEGMGEEVREGGVRV